MKLVMITRSQKKIHLCFVFFTVSWKLNCLHSGFFSSFNPERKTLDWRWILYFKYKYTNLRELSKQPTGLFRSLRKSFLPQLLIFSQEAPLTRKWFSRRSCIRPNWNLEMLIFEERGKPENPEKNHSEQSKEPTTNLTHSWPEPGRKWEASAITTTSSPASQPLWKIAIKTYARLTLNFAPNQSYSFRGNTCLLLLGITPLPSSSPSAFSRLACHHSSSLALVTWRISPYLKLRPWLGRPLSLVLS